MSFSSRVKDELAHLEPDAGRHCLISQLSAMINNSAATGFRFNCLNITLYTENIFLAHAFSFLTIRAFGHTPDCFIRSGGKNYYCAQLSDGGVAEKMLRATGCYPPGERRGDPLILKRDCCKRAYLRGAFLSNASLSDPEKNYHLEFVFLNGESADAVLKLLEYFELKPRLIMRKKHFVVYLKDGEKISEALGLIGAHQSMLEFESLRVFKTVSNEINRKVNCETANMAKTARAFVSFQEDMAVIEHQKGRNYLSKQLLEAAEARLEYPGATLKEIGEMLNPPISKSGVNHRLRKISEIADKLRRDENG